MKKLLFIAMMATAATTNAQMTLEHTYSSNWIMEAVNIEGDGGKYVGVEEPSKKIIIYNADHTVWKTINTAIPATASIYGANTFASKYLFNTDAKIEVAVVYIDGVNFKGEIYNEDGTVLLSVNKCQVFQLKKVNADWKLLAQLANTGTPTQITAVYSLPGQYTGMRKPKTESGETAIYPNPMDNAATIEYSLPSGVHTAKLNVYNMQMQLLRSYDITDQFHNIIIQREDMPAGNYLYNIEAAGTTPITKQFVVQ